MNLKTRIKHLCEKHGAEYVAQCLAEYFIGNMWRQYDDFKYCFDSKLKNK